VISLSRVLRSGTVTATPKAYGGGAPRLLDAELRKIVDIAAESAYSQGFNAGIVEGRGDTASVATRLGSSVLHAIHELRRAREADIAASIDLAIEMATVILGHAPVGDRAAMIQRVLDALAEVDDTTVTIAAHPADVGLLQEAVRGDVEVRADDTLAPGEVRILGDWARVDLTHESVLAVMKEGLL
jgi:flagellar biosynthesis/type III secretory pathway protein FliH